MRIYQIHEYGGEWEDSYDDIIESYICPERAENRRQELERLQNEKIKCSECPIYFCFDGCNDDCENCDGSELAKEYCESCDVFMDKSGKIKCKNYIYVPYGSRFYIQEVNVIE